MRGKVIFILLAFLAFGGFCFTIFAFVRGSGATVGYGLGSLFSASILAVAYDDFGKYLASRRANETENLD
jgi:hypothetical protein